MEPSRMEANSLTSSEASIKTAEAISGLMVWGHYTTTHTPLQWRSQQILNEPDAKFGRFSAFVPSENIYLHKPTLDIESSFCMLRYSLLWGLWRHIAKSTNQCWILKFRQLQLAQWRPSSGSLWACKSQWFT